MTNKHTATPWNIDGGTNNKGDLYIWKTGEYYGGDHGIATIHGEIQEGAKANAELIVKAVNCHDQLLEALHGLLPLGYKALNSTAHADQYETSKAALLNAEAAIKAVERTE